MPFPQNLYNIAKCQQKLANYEEAIKYYKEYLNSYKEMNQKDPPDIKDVQETVELLEQSRVKALPLVTIKSVPEGANIFLDDKDTIRGQSSRSFNLEPGQHKLWLYLNGYEPFETDFAVEKGKNLDLNFELKKIQLVGDVLLQVNIKGARVYMDGKPIGITPMKDPITVAVGAHQVIIEKDRYSTVNETVTVAQGEKSEKKYDLYLVEKPPSWRGTLGWTLFSVGLLGLATGITFLELKDSVFNGKITHATKQKISLGGFIGGGVLLGSGIGFVLWEYLRSAVDKNDMAYVPNLEITPNNKGGWSFGAGWEF
jgi:hypothetical protein